MQKIAHFTSKFGFHSMPFTCELRIEDGFAGPLFDEPHYHLINTIDKRMSAVLVAPAGTGKTFILRRIAAKLPEARYRLNYIKVTDLSKRDFCREIARVVGAEPAGTYPALFRSLQNFFHEAYDVEGRRPVLIIDEAHDMRPDVLSILRLLTNFEMDSKLVVSIIIAGQPRLATMLRMPMLDDIQQRLGHCATLRLLSRQETVEYVKHRCRIAGVAACPFDPAAIEAVYEIGKGNLRATNQLALKALEVTYHAQHDVVDATHVTHARSMIWP